MFDFLNQGGFQQTANPTPEQQGELAEQWKGWLTPSNRAALMQFGVSLMQPVGLGQTSMGHFGQALGRGGEAAARVGKQDLAEQELQRKKTEDESEATLRSARAATAEAGAGAAGTRVELARSRLEMERERLGLDRERAEGAAAGRSATQLIRAQQLYQREVADIQKRNNDILKSGPKEDVPTWEQWLQKYPDTRNALGVTGATSAPSGGSGASSAYPDARQAKDGNWYVQRNGQYFKVQ